MAKTKLSLYYFPASFYSQKALLALFEKRAEFDRNIVLIHFGEQNQEWYMKINPKGVVPVLKDGDKYISESEVIVDYVDKRLETGPCIVPNVHSRMGQAVDKWRKKLAEVDVEHISYGIMMNLDLSESGLIFSTKGTPFETKEGMLKMLEKSRLEVLKKAEEQPDLRDAYLVKAKAVEDRARISQDRSLVMKLIEELELFFDDIEKQLSETIKDQGVLDVWLVGTRFTAADINLTILLDRLRMLGIHGRFVNTSKRPLLLAYYERLEQKESVKLLRKEFNKTPFLFIKRKLKKMLPYAVSVFAVAAVAGAVVCKMRN